jgi:glycosyltransferase involved in cell wall biosynthesis
MRPPARLAIVVSHPIQHFVPFYRELARRPEVEAHVFYGARIGTQPYFDREMNTELSWKMDLLGGYPHSFLPKADTVEQTSLRALNDPGVTAALAGYRPDAVLIYGYDSLTALRALAWCKRRRVPALMIADSEMRQKRSGPRNTAKRLLLPRLLGRFSGFLTVGDENERYYRHYGVPQEKMFRSPFTIDEESFRAAAAAREELRASVREEHSIPADAFLCLFVGKLSDRKRPGDLVAAVRRLGDPRVRAVLAGNGPLLESLKREAQGEDAVTFAGFVNLDRLPALYVAADVLVHTSSADPHPLVCSEAACVGLPMILSDRVGAAGPTDVARPGENAIVYPCGDAAALAQAIGRMSGDEALTARMAARSAEIFGDVDVEASVAGLLRALDAVRR